MKRLVRFLLHPCSSIPLPNDCPSTPRCKYRYVFGILQRGFRINERSVTVILFQIQLKAEDLYDKEKVDLETIVIEDVFKLLQCDEAGLGDQEGARRLEIFGPNRLEHEEQNPFLQASLPANFSYFHSHFSYSF